MKTRPLLSGSVLLFALLTIGTAAGGDDSSQPPSFDDRALLTPLLLSVPHAPQPVRATDGKFHLVYELRLLNFGSFGAVKPPAPVPPAALQVTEVAVFAGEAQTPLLLFTVDDLANRMQLLRLGIAPTVVLHEGQSGIVFLDVTFTDRRSVPTRIRHRVKVVAVPGTGPQPVVDETGLEIAVDQRPVIVIGPPLRGGAWANFNGCCDFVSPHRRVGRAVNGQPFWPERFAVDLIKAEIVGNQYTVFRNDGSRVGDWFDVGEDVLAVADGVVTRVVDGLPNNVISEVPFPPEIAKGGGNEVLLHIGDGIFTMYGHLLPGSVAVRLGDRVRRGQVLGKLGNTGQSTAPHLHFQVMDDNSIGASQGLPWVVDKFSLLGTFEELDGDQGTLTGFTDTFADRRRGELPLQQTLIQFPR